MGSNAPRLGLTLSGGGFRATLFHLGVVRLLYETGLLPEVKRIGAVSGGSILAAHLVLNWDRYTGSQAEFDSAGREIIEFVRSDIRGRVVRRWILAWLTIIPRLLKRKYWTFTNILQRFYRKLYKDATLGDLLPEAGVDRPQVFFYCTSLSTGSVCSFGRSGFMWDEENVERSIVAPETPVAFAVAASSAFPPLFPPIAISNEILSCDIKDFPNPQYLTDGGVYDNLGIDRLIWYHKQANDLDQFIISDAEGNFDWDFGKKYTFITGRNIRASNLLMKRVSSLEYESLAAQGAPITIVEIDTEVQRPGDPAVLGPEVQRSLRNVRTDLDAFSSMEVACLIQHGYTVARERLIQQGLVPQAAPVFSWKSLSDEKAFDRREVLEIRRSRDRKLRLWSFRDWASWVSLLVVVAIAMAVAVPGYLERRRLEERADASARLEKELTQQVAISRNLREENEELGVLAVDYFRGRRRPVVPGMSAGHYGTTAGTVCCVVKLRNRSPERYLLGTADVFAPSGYELDDPILQPGAADGGQAPRDAVARLSRVLRPDPTGANALLGAIARLLPDVEATNSIPSIGSIHGTADTLRLGQEVLIVGRTTGIAKFVVTDLDAVISFPLPGSDAPTVFDGVIALKAGQSLLSGGNSGAPVVTADGRLAGMIFAGSPGLSYAFPIRRVFDALQIELAEDGLR